MVIPAPPGHHVFAMTPTKLLLAWLPLEILQLTSGSQAQKGHWLVISFTWRNFHSLWLKQLKFLNLGLSPVSWIPTDSQGHSVSISWGNLSTKVSSWPKDNQSWSLHLSRFKRVLIKGPIRAFKEISEEEKKFSEWPHETTAFSSSMCNWEDKDTAEQALRRNRPTWGQKQQHTVCSGR